MSSMSCHSRSACSVKPNLYSITKSHGPRAHRQFFTSRRPRSVTVHAEKDPKLQEQEEASKQPVNKGGNAYIDELPPTPRSEVSPEMKKRLRDEYIGFGGAPNKPLAQNWFLIIILGVTFLVALTYLTGTV